MPLTFHMSSSDKRLIGGWLLVCCVLVFSMIMLGGVTRLTQSGLSMVEWEPIIGVVPPLTETEWLDTFEKYQAYPEYQLINKDIALSDFKGIFYVEYAHRILGRVLGIAFLIPFLFFLLARKLDSRLTFKLLVLFVLGGLQGLLGWYMVQSGLIDHPRVSPYRLTAHLMLALLILGYMLWLAFGLLARNTRSSEAIAPRVVKYYAWTVLVAVVLMIFTGGFVAGTKAGYAFNTFPKMYGQWVPEGLWLLQPLWRNLFENIPTVQFIHRCMAFILAILMVGFWYLVRSANLSNIRFSCNILLASFTAQVVFGISTLVYVVPVPLAAAHQGGALIVFSVILFITHQLQHTGNAETTQKPEHLTKPVH